MLPEFNQLSNPEVELLIKAPFLVCILIAGADNNIDRSEIKGAISLAEKKQKKSRPRLVKFYHLVGEDFEDKLKIVMQALPIEATQRNPLILEELSQINTVMPKLERSFAVDLYESLKEIAREVAESSGGVLGIKTVGSEEARFINLSVIKDPAHNGQ